MDGGKAMKIRSHFNIGQKVFSVRRQSVHAFQKCPCCEHGKLYMLDKETFECPRCAGKGLLSENSILRYYVGAPMTIGQIRFEIDLDRFKETYMCIETGVGGGMLHSCEDLMETEELAQEEANKRNNMAGQSWACTRCVPKYKPIEYRADTSFRDWRHCPVHGSSLHLEIESADSHLETYLKEKLEREKEED